MTIDEFNELPIVMSFFPLTFDNGSQCWTQLQVECGSCKRMVPEKCTRGHVEKELQSGGYRNNVTVSYHVIAHALCPRCDKLTTADYLLHEDMTLTETHSKAGDLRRWKMQRSSRWKRFVRWAKALWKR